MTFEEFVAEYNRLLNRMMEYTTQEVGSIVYAEKLGELVDAYPEFEQAMEDAA